MRHIFFSFVFLLFAASGFAQVDTLNWDTLSVTGVQQYFPQTYGLSSATVTLTTSNPTAYTNMIGAYMTTYPSHAYGNGKVIQMLNGGSGSVGSEDTGTVYITFSQEVTNVAFTVFDIDGSQPININAQNAAGAAVNLSGVAVGPLEGFNGLSVNGGAVNSTVPVTSTTISTTGLAGGYTPTTLNGAARPALNISISGPVKTISIYMGANIVGDHYIYVSDITATLTSPLPVNLVSFEAGKDGERTELSWTTAREENNSGFETQRSTDGKNWTSLAFVASKAEGGNSDNNIDYLAFDTKPQAGVNLYRLKQVDKDGKATYSGISKVMHQQNNNVTVYPNPATGKVTLDIANSSTVKEVRMLNVNGKLVYRNAGSVSEINLANFGSGIYLLQVEQNDGTVSSSKLVCK